MGPHVAPHMAPQVACGESMEQEGQLHACTWLRSLKGPLQGLEGDAPASGGDATCETTQRSPNPSEQI